MNKLLLLFLMIILVGGCHRDNALNQVSWTGSSHSLADTLISNDGDTLVNLKYLYIAHSINIKMNGQATLITRKQYDAPREFYSIRVNDNVKDEIFQLLSDTSITNFKQPHFNQIRAGRLYCGYNYLLTIDKGNAEQNITYHPPDANIKLKKLDSLFNTLWFNPEIINKIQIDTTTFDSIIFEKVQMFNPMPPLRSTIKFEPPDINIRK